MLNTYLSKIIISSILLVLLIAAGIYIHRTGKPYHTLIFGIHKLFSVALIVILSLVFNHYLKGTDAGFFHYLLPGMMILALVSLLISGGMMSLDRNQQPMLVIHRVSTAIFLVGFLPFVYMIFK
jgi:hypothetical protein